MKKLLTVFLIFSLIQFQATSQNAAANKPLPNGKVKSLDGKISEVKTFTQAGKITIVSFWATWCGPCKKELDAYSSLYANWQKKYNVQLLAISTDDLRGQAKIKPMVNERRWPYTILIDANNDLQRQLGFNSIPQLFLLDKKGHIVFQQTGYLPGAEKELEAKMAALMKIKV